MEKIYFVRHGESEANVERKFAGQKEDSPLTELGLEQAKQAALDLLKHGYKIDRVISSPLARAYETAQIVVKEAALDLEVELDKRIAEYDMGALTGTPHHKITSEELVSTEGAEDPRAFQNRVQDLLNELQDKDQNVLLVSHAGVGRIIEITKKSLDPNNFYDLEALPNAKIIVLP
jgi:broad specificity phosphatase PhoE